MEFINNRTEFYRYLYHHCHCCNAGQSNEERRKKYQLARYLGQDSKGASKYRNWYKQTFAKRFGYSSWDDMLKSLGGDRYTKIEKTKTE